MAKLVYGKFNNDVVALRQQFEIEAARGERKALTTGIDYIDKVVTTMGPKKLTSVLAMNSNFKTSFAVHLARRRAEEIMRGENGFSDQTHYVGFATLEEYEVDIHMSLTNCPYTADQVERGEYDPQILNRATLDSANWPYLMIGHEPRQLAKHRFDKLPRITIEQIMRELHAMEVDSGMMPAALFFDYLQIMDTEAKGYERRISVGNIMHELKTLAKKANCPVVVLVQANRKAAERTPPVPTVVDAYESSVVEHASDVMWSLAITNRYSKDAWGNEGMIEEVGGRFPWEKDHLLYLRLLKQRRGQGTANFVAFFDPIKRTIRAANTV